MDTKEIMPLHLFQYNGENYVINIEKMQTETVDQYSCSCLEETGTEGYVAEHTPITHMSLLVTQSCNLRCVYCYEDKTNARMEEATAFRAVDWFIRKSEDMRLIHIVFFGGEPLLNFPLIQAVVDYAEKAAQKAGKQVKYSITTNGTLLEDEKIQFLEKHNIVTMISFDGLKELQDTQRPFPTGSGSYDLVVPKIKKLLEAMPQTAGHAVIMGNTSPEVVKDALQELGFRRVSVAMNSQSLFSENKSETKASERDTQCMMSALEEEAENWYTHIKARDFTYIRKLIGRSYLYGALLSLLNHTKKRYFCGAGRSMATITPSGDIYLCHRFVGLENYRIGSIDEYELSLEHFGQSPVETNNICRSCFAKYYCGGGCKHDHVSSSGSIHQPEEQMCLLKRKELELAATVVSRLSVEDRNCLIKEKIFPPKPCPLDF